MKSFLIATATISVFFAANVSHAQFNFGNVIKGEARKAFRKIENKVRDKIREEVPKFKTLPFKPPVKTLPYVPPVKTLPYFPPKKKICPPVTTPIVRPVPKPEPKPAPEPEPNLPQLELGQVISIDGEGFGSEPGDVFVKIDSLVLAAELVDWNDDQAQAQLPTLPILEAAKATVFVMDANEEVVQQVDIMVTPPTETADDSEEVDNGGGEESDAPLVHAGQEVTLEGELGEQRGRVEVRMGVVKLQAKITEWKSSETTLVVPEVKTAEIHPATIVVYTAAGKVVEEIEVQYSGESEK